MDELINKLYKICQSNSKEELENNKELFQDFYYKFKGIYKPDFRAYLIFKTILNNSNLINTEYCISEIIDFIKHTQEYTCWKSSQNEVTSLDDIDNMLKEIKEYKDILNIVTNPNYKTLNSINEGSINSYKKSEIYLYYTDALTKILSKNYLSIPKEKCDNIMELIYNSSYLNDLINGNKKNSMLNRDLIYKYIERILPIKEFLSQENISDDILISSIKKGTIQDSRLIKTLISKLSVIKLLNIFDNDINNIVEFIINTKYIDDVIKHQVISTLVNKCLKEECYTSIIDILEGKYKDNFLISKIINDDIKTVAIYYTLNDCITDEKYINYLLDNDKITINFISNIMNYSKEKWQPKLMEKEILLDKYFEVGVNSNDSIDLIQKKLKIYNITGKVVDSNIAKNLLSKYFANEINLSEESAKNIVRSIITEQLKEHRIEKVKVLYQESDTINGQYSDNEKIISLSNSLIRNFLDNTKTDEERLNLFITIFHEMRHAIQFNNIKNNNYDYDTYTMLKEEIIINYDTNYYESNYKMFLMEIDARKGGLEDSYQFFSKTFPNIAPIIKNIYDKRIERYEYEDYNKKQFTITKKEELIDLIFDRLVEVHPNLTEQYPILKTEYETNGLLKDYKEIESSESANNELIKNILTNRYKESNKNKKH